MLHEIVWTGYEAGGCHFNSIFLGLMLIYTSGALLYDKQLYTVTL